MNKKILLLVVIVFVIAVTVFMSDRRKVVSPAVRVSKPPPARSEPVLSKSPVPSVPMSLSHSVRSAAVTNRQAGIMDELGKLQISPAVRTLIGLDENAGNKKARQDALKKMTRDLSPDDVKALLLFFDTLYTDQKALPQLVFNALKNDALDVLMRQTKLTTGVGENLTRMFQDKEQDDVWRDYCIQYLAPYYERKWGAAQADRTHIDAEQKAIEDTYWAAIQAKDKTFAGTALLAMESLSRTPGSSFDRKKVEETAVALANDDQCGEAARITALRIAGQIGRTGVLPAARQVAQTGSTTMLRMAAVATVGDLGDKTDLELLQSLANDSENRVRTVADAALKKLKARVEPKV